MLKKLRNLFADEKGAATVEFVTVFPFFVYVFLSAFEVAAMNIRAVSLERATDIAVRDLRLTGSTGISYGEILKGVCDGTFMIPKCLQSVKIQMVPVSTQAWNMPAGNIDCVQRGAKVQPAAMFHQGMQNELMLLRVCAVVDPVFPTVGIGRTMPKDSSGGYVVSAYAAFVNEPD